MGLDIAVLAFVGVVVLVMVLGCLINLFQKKCPQLLPRQLRCPLPHELQAARPPPHGEQHEAKNGVPNAG